MQPAAEWVEHLAGEGYAIVRGFLSPAETAEIAAETDKMYAEGLKHHATYRHKNLLFEILDDPKAKRRVVLQAHWTAWISLLMERMRAAAPSSMTCLRRFWGRTSSKSRISCIGNRLARSTPRTASTRTRAFARAR
jgi:hypothetical protein